MVGLNRVESKLEVCKYWNFIVELNNMHNNTVALIVVIKFRIDLTFS